MTFGEASPVRAGWARSRSEQPEGNHPPLKRSEKGGAKRRSAQAALGACHPGASEARARKTGDTGCEAEEPRSEGTLTERGAEPLRMKTRAAERRSSTLGGWGDAYGRREMTRSFCRREDACSRLLSRRTIASKSSTAWATNLGSSWSIMRMGPCSTIRLSSLPVRVWNSESDLSIGVL